MAAGRPGRPNEEPARSSVNLVESQRPGRGFRSQIAGRAAADASGSRRAMIDCSLRDVTRLIAGAQITAESMASDSSSDDTSSQGDSEGELFDRDVAEGVGYQLQPVNQPVDLVILAFDGLGNVDLGHFFNRVIRVRENYW